MIDDRDGTFHGPLPDRRFSLARVGQENKRQIDARAKVTRDGAAPIDEDGRVIQLPIQRH